MRQGHKSNHEFSESQSTQRQILGEPEKNTIDICTEKIIGRTKPPFDERLQYEKKLFCSLPTFLDPEIAIQSVTNNTLNRHRLHQSKLLDEETQLQNYISQIDRSWARRSLLPNRLQQSNSTQKDIAWVKNIEKDYQIVKNEKQNFSRSLPGLSNKRLEVMYDGLLADFKVQNEQKLSTKHRISLLMQQNDQNPQNSYEMIDKLRNIERQRHVQEKPIIDEAGIQKYHKKTQRIINEMRTRAWQALRYKPSASSPSSMEASTTDVLGQPNQKPHSQVPEALEQPHSDGLWRMQQRFNTSRENHLRRPIVPTHIVDTGKCVSLQQPNQTNTPKNKDFPQISRKSQSWHISQPKLSEISRPVYTNRNKEMQVKEKHRRIVTDTGVLAKLYQPYEQKAEVIKLDQSTASDAWSQQASKDYISEKATSDQPEKVVSSKTLQMQQLTAELKFRPAFAQYFQNEETTVTEAVENLLYSMDETISDHKREIRDISVNHQALLNRIRALQGFYNPTLTFDIRDLDQPKQLDWISIKRGGITRKILKIALAQ